MSLYQYISTVKKEQSDEIKTLKEKVELTSKDINLEDGKVKIHLSKLKEAGPLNVNDVPKNIKDYFKALMEYEECYENVFTNVIGYNKINPLRNYFKNKYDINANDYVLINNEDINNIINACEEILKTHNDNGNTAEISQKLFPPTEDSVLDASKYNEYYNELNIILNDFRKIKEDNSNVKYYYSCWY